MLLFFLEEELNKKFKWVHEISNMFKMSKQKLVSTDYI
jgi:hypothetical protein